MLDLKYLNPAFFSPEKLRRKKNFESLSLFSIFLEKRNLDSNILNLS